MVALDEQLHVVREYPQAKFPFLRVQIGEMRTRPETFPLYDGGNCIGHRSSGYFVSVFHLLGCGETLKKAKSLLPKKEKLVSL
jgi:hypothetical protein